MATQTQNPVEKAKEVASSESVKKIDKQTKPFQQFLTKFNNDGSMTFAGTLAYNLMLAMFPILIALLAILGFTLGRLDPSAVANIQNQITAIFPGGAADQIVKGALKQLSNNAGVFALLAVIVAVIGGSRLFIVIEQFLDLIYHLRPRTLIRQNLVAIGMLLLFVVLIPLMVFASSIPNLSFLPFLRNNALIAIPVGILIGIIVGFILFEAIYFVMPNQKISWGNSWRGALIASVLLEVYLFAFPFYASHFLKGYSGVIGGGIILLLFFYYFAVILLLGAEINAFFSERVQPLPNDVFTFVTTMAGRVNEDRPDAEAEDHMDARPTDRAADARVGGTRGSEQRTSQKETRGSDQKASQKETHEQRTSQKETRGSDQKASQKNEQKQQRVASNARLKQQVKEQKEMTKSPSTSITFIEIAVGAVLTVVIEFLRLQRHRK